MANSFNDFFVNIGNTIEEKIPPGNIHFSNFLKNSDIEESLVLIDEFFYGLVPEIEVSWLIVLLLFFDGLFLI